MTPFTHALASILPAWRQVRDRNLPLWRFLGRGPRLPRFEALRAQLRCEKCAARALCDLRVRRRRVRPVADCPNGRLFAIR